ncbi:MAG: GNAT family N-acetyltransferase [Burkholderiaceae bacterium]|nr:GNAT family N-acetyltransferase [Burkholderiaceae bacterium]
MTRAEATDSEAAPIETLGERDLQCALALSRAASWNQNEADWRTMLALGRGWCIRSPDDASPMRLAASIVLLPYGVSFAWVSMVLVAPEFRGRGFAARLLRHALAELSRDGRGGVLDATPAGRPVYAREGFVDSWGFQRYRRDPVHPAPAPSEAFAAAPELASRRASPPACRIRPLRESDWPTIAALDLPAFGADRSPLLRGLAARLPQVAHVAERDGALAGFVLGRDGREAVQLGPLVAEDAGVARALLDAALACTEGPIYLDAADRQQALLAAMAERGFAPQRPFTRMLYGMECAPGDASKVFLVAGPELG